jgi:tetratricopeptide (TPR) repeat protein
VIRHRGMTGLKASVIGFAVAGGLAFGITGCGPKPEPVPGPEAQPAEEVLTLEERHEIAQAYLDEGRVGDAAENYRDILRESPRDFEAHLNLAIALMAMEDAKFANERDYTEVRQHLLAAKDARGSDYRPYARLGRLEFEAGNYAAAAEYLSAARNLEAGDESVHEMLGISLIKIGNEKAGRRELERTLEIDPENPAANFELGKIYEKENNNELAMRHLEKALAASPNLDMATYLLERVYYEEKLYDRAESACREFLKYHPEDVQSLEILGWIYRHLERTDDMLEVYSELTRISPDNTSYWSPLIQHYIDNSNFAEARDMLEECLGHNPYYAYGNIRYGQVLMHYADEVLQNGDNRQALELFTRAREHFEKAKVDDRYSATASQLVDLADGRIRDISGP